MTDYRLVAEPDADADVEAAFRWYEHESPGLGVEFLDELRSTYGRVVVLTVLHVHRDPAAWQRSKL